MLRRRSAEPCWAILLLYIAFASRKKRQTSSGIRMASSIAQWHSTFCSSLAAYTVLFGAERVTCQEMFRRLMAPAEEYVSTFAPTLQRAQLAWRCAAVMHDNPSISYEAALPHVRPPVLDILSGPHLNR